MILVAVFTTALWFGSNAEFVEAVNQNAADGMSWHYVGKQEPSGTPALTLESQNGEEFILWQMQ